MLESIWINLSRRIAGGARQTFAEMDYRLAAAEILLRAAESGGRIVQVERVCIKS